MIYTGKAIWSRSVPIDDGQLIGQELRKVEFPACEYEPKKKAQLNIGRGLVASYRIAIRTDKKVAEDIEADDVIVWKGRTWSVLEMTPIRSSAYINASEYIIWLH